jgi:hypothetical protein
MKATHTYKSCSSVDRPKISTVVHAVNWSGSKTKLNA